MIVFSAGPTLYTFLTPVARYNLFVLKVSLNTNQLTKTYVQEIRKIIIELLVLATRLSTSLKIIESHTDRSATYDFLFAIRDNHGPISYRVPL